MQPKRKLWRRWALILGVLGGIAVFFYKQYEKKQHALQAASMEKRMDEVMSRHERQMVALIHDMGEKNDLSMEMSDRMTSVMGSGNALNDSMHVILEPLSEQPELLQLDILLDKVQENESDIFSGYRTIIGRQDSTVAKRLQDFSIQKLGEYSYNVSVLNTRVRQVLENFGSGERE